MANKVLVAGASGLVGRAAIEHFSALGWDVVGVSRRLPDDLDGDAQLISVDLMDRDACERAFGAMHDVTHLAYAALYEKPGLFAGWRERDQMDTNLAMLANLFEPLEHAAAGLRHVSLLQGTKAYGAHFKPIGVPARERWPRDAHENFYWLQEDFLRERQLGKAWSWTVVRPQIVFGHAVGAPMNPIAAVGVYAAIRRELGLPLSYPGGPPVVMEAADSRIVARMLAWAATEPACGNQIFNVANGDVFVWPYVWPAIARCFDMDTGRPEPMFLAEEMPKYEAVWQDLVARHGLRRHTIRELVGDSFHYVDGIGGTGRERAPPPAIVSTIKARQMGFHDCIDTEDMFAYWFDRLRALKILPPL
ncbi:SDR family oxidoreductase [Iodidimonas sp. SYSU 1G8]|uniref:SDR family oxidoreductase n=1 Tax=Iodidimonas sp. SYSU 1G8 TaxID=3133967 RepID=UPI0031FE809C